MAATDPPASDPLAPGAPSWPEAAAGPDFSADERRLLTGGAAALGVNLNAGQVEQFGRLYVALQQGAQAMNLTALKDGREIVLKHFVDSLGCLQAGVLAQGSRVLDLGTGAGFPAFPLAIARPDLQLVAVDATHKKIGHVSRVAAQLQLPVTGLAGRAETLGRDPQHRGQYDVVVTRAVAALPILVELALPLLKEGGTLVAQKADLARDELEAGRQAAETVGGQVTQVLPYALPVLGDARSLVLVVKVAPTPDTYPRREGVPNKRPLHWSPKRA